MLTSAELENLVKIGKLKREPPSAQEIDGLVRSGAARLADAANPSLAPESRFDLAYNAAHALSLAALRRAGYRSDNRYVVFQALTATLGIPPATWRVLAQAHEHRNRIEYEGAIEIDERLLLDLVQAGDALLAALRALPPLAPT